MIVVATTMTIEFESDEEDFLIRGFIDANNRLLLTILSAGAGRLATIKSESSTSVNFASVGYALGTTQE